MFFPPLIRAIRLRFIKKRPDWGWISEAQYPSPFVILRFSHHILIAIWAWATEGTISGFHPPLAAVVWRWWYRVSSPWFCPLFADVAAHGPPISSPLSTSDWDCFLYHQKQLYTHNCCLLDLVFVSRNTLRQQKHNPMKAKLIWTGGNNYILIN